MDSWDCRFIALGWRHRLLPALMLLAVLFFGLGHVGCASTRQGDEQDMVGRHWVGEADWPVSGEVVEVQWRVSGFASQFWIIDQLSRWDERLISPEYRRYFEVKGGVDAKDQAMLEAYAQVRRAHSGARFARVAEGQGMFLDLLSPMRSYEEFSQVFLGAENLEQAVSQAGLNSEEGEVLRAVFAHFEPRIERLLASADYLRYAAKRLEVLGRRGELGGYLSRMAAFFGVEERHRQGLVVEIVWAPDGFAQATQYGSQVVIPLPSTSAVEERDLAGWLGVIVHEFGHYFVSSMNSQWRQTASNRILNEVGVVNARRANVVDEALATALGNIVYMRRSFPEYFEERVFYSYDPDYEYPYAIDSLARALAPQLEVFLGQQGGAFDEAFLGRLIEIHREVFRPMPRHHTRITLVYAENVQMARTFVGLFPGIRQLHRVGNEAAFVADSARQHESPRWVLMTADRILEHPERAQILSIPLIDRLARRVHDGQESSCFQAYRRREHGPFDFVAVGRTADDLRRILIHAHTYVGIPAEMAICLSEAR